jgi:signal transduction histidine kinase
MNGLQILGHGGRIELATHDDDHHLYIEMADDGPGIDPAERTKVFEAFFFKREGGIGLGLAIVQQIVSAHGGEIEAAESRLGGALFRIRLPRKQTGIT